LKGRRYQFFKTVTKKIGIIAFMQRGHQSLFAEFLPIATPSEKSRKGRSETLDSQRNECIIDRYLFVVSNTGLRYDLVIKIISADFFLAERTITDLLSNNHHQLKKARDLQLERKDLEKKWPQYNWEAPVLKMYL
jgi:hypothetical protein